MKVSAWENQVYVTACILTNPNSKHLIFDIQMKVIVVLEYI